MKTFAADSRLSQTLCRNVLSQRAEQPSSVCGSEIKDELAGRKKGEKGQKLQALVLYSCIPACHCRRLQQMRPMPIFATFFR